MVGEPRHRVGVMAVAGHGLGERRFPGTPVAAGRDQPQAALGTGDHGVVGHDVGPGLDEAPHGFGAFGRQTSAEIVAPHDGHRDSSPPMRTAGTGDASNNSTTSGKDPATLS